MKEIDWWTRWIVPGSRTPVFMLSGIVSTPEADRYVFGDKAAPGNIDFKVAEHQLYVRGVDGVTLASMPCPDTFEEAVAWMRMVAQFTGGVTYEDS